MLLASTAPPASGGARFDGKKVFQERACFACHAVGARSTGPGPELTQIAYQRDATWLRAWLADPPKIKKDTSMPKFPWSSQAEIDAVIGYILDARRPIPVADSANGAKLMDDFNCTSCHAVQKKGGKPQFPDLARPTTDLEKVRDAAFYDKWLQDPQSVLQGTFMATFPLSPTQRQSIVAYLVSIPKTIPKATPKK
jgi:cytochrome c2